MDAHSANLVPMGTVIITGSGGLVGGAATKFFSELGHDVVGVDNDMRKQFFGDDASTAAQTEALQRKFPRFTSLNTDIRDINTLEKVFSDRGRDIFAVIHCAAQPSHDWAAKDPALDFSVNATGTLGLLELTRTYCPDASFVFMSTNKVYGDRPNSIDFDELDTRWSPPADSRWHQGFDESLSIDQSTHSLFGVSKTAADLLVQEYGRYFNMNTVCFRGGCLTGPDHAGVELHGFLSYLVKCTVWGKPYRIFGHLGKQVRDNIHTDDLVNAFWEYIQKPRPGAVYNMGGGVSANVSMLEAINEIESISGNTLDWALDSTSRVGDHIWYVSDTSAFERDYPTWSITRGISDILNEMVEREQTVKAAR